MKNPKLWKNGSKLAIMGIGSLLIGTIIKLEKKLDTRIDEYFSDPKPESDEDN